MNILGNLKRYPWTIYIHIKVAVLSEYILFRVNLIMARDGMGVVNTRERPCAEWISRLMSTGATFLRS
jgi:hypothetical protein